MQTDSAAPHARSVPLAVLLDLLHAAERARVDSGPDEQLGAFHTDGLILAARQLVREAHHCLAGSAA